MNHDDYEELKDAKNKNRIARWESIGAKLIEADLLTNDGLSYVGAPDRHAMAWKWLQFKKAQPAN